MIIDHPFAFYLSLFLVTLALGFWLGRQFSTSRIRRLKQRLDISRLVP